MNSKKMTEAQINRIVEENRRLKLENRGLKKLVNSKRFKFAEKIATRYNNIFPKDTKRRVALERIAYVGKYFLNKKNQIKIRKIQKSIIKISKNYCRIIVLNSIPWDTQLKQRPHHLAEEFRKLGFFVIYLEEGSSILFRHLKEGMISLNDYNIFLDLFESENKYFLSPNNISTDLETLLKIKKAGFGIIYDYLDEFHEDISGDISTQLKVWDNLKKIKPVLCTATAIRLHDELKKHLGSKQKIIMARNAVNIDHFDYTKNKTKTPPEDMAKIIKKNKSIVGFYGALAPWIDFELINSVAKKYTGLEFVLIGIDYNGAASEIAKLKNLHNLGPKDYKDLSKYTKFFDCAIIPFKEGEIAKATSPVKLFEYMAAGLPTICTKDLIECSGYEYVYMAKNKADFGKLLEKAISEKENNKSREKLLFQAKNNTWANRAKTIADNLK